MGSSKGPEEELGTGAPAPAFVRPRPQTIPKAGAPAVEETFILGELDADAGDEQVIDLEKNGFEIVFKDSGRREVVSITPVAEEIAEKVESVVQRPLPNKMQDATEVIPRNELKLALTKNPLFAKLGRVTMNALFKGAKSVMVPKGAEIIGPNNASKGMFIPYEDSLKVQISTGEKEELAVKERVLTADSYLGEYVMAVGIKPTATVTSLSDKEVEMIFISQELFESLHPRSKEEIKRRILETSPLVNYNEHDPSLDSEVPNVSQSGYMISEKRDKVMAIFQGLTVANEAGDVFKPNYVKTYQKDETIVPHKPGYLGLIMQGTVSVNQTSIGDELVAIKKAQIEAGNTIFEANAVGVNPPSNIELNAESPVHVLWVYLSPDDPNYEELLDAALDGQASKLANANIRVGAIKSLS